MFIHTYLPKNKDKKFREYMKLLNKKEYQLAQELIISGLDVLSKNIEYQGKKEGIIAFLKKDLEELGRDVARF